MVQLPGDEGGRPGVVSGAGVGLGLAGQQRGVLLRDRDPRGQEVHVESDRFLHHGPVVVARLARHVGVQVSPVMEKCELRDKKFRIRARPDIHIHNPLPVNKIYITFPENVLKEEFIKFPIR